MRVPSEVGGRVALTTLTTVLCLILAEGFLRASGFGAAAPPLRHPIHPGMMQPDLLLGWKPRAGIYEFPALAPLPDGSPAPMIRLSFSEDLGRSTGPPVDGHRGAIVLVGCSFTMGHGISDEETFGWKLQQAMRRPVFNHGVGGYGSYQSYLSLKRVLAELSPPPSVVIYGFAGFHATRNAAPVHWLKELSDSSSGRPVTLPYATLARDGSLIASEPAVFPAGLSQHPLNLYRLLREAGLRLMAWPRWRARIDTTIAIIRSMDQLSREHGARLVVVDLNSPKPKYARRYAEFVAESGIPWVNCEVPEDPVHQVPGDGHPNGLANTKYARCIAAFLETFEGRRAPASQHQATRAYENQDAALPQSARFVGSWMKEVGIARFPQRMLSPGARRW
jgi:hypothetical protein